MHSTQQWDWGLSSAAKRALKSYSKEKKLVAEFENAINNICANPYAGSPKHADLQGLWGWHIRWAGATYCIAYSLNEAEHFVRIIMVGAHERFYDDLKIYIKSRH